MRSFSDTPPERMSEEQIKAEIARIKAEIKDDDNSVVKFTIHQGHDRFKRLLELIKTLRALEENQDV